MTRYADCRRCIYFISYDELDENMKSRAKDGARQRGGIPLGWCSRYNRVVTYYTGGCRGYKAKIAMIRKLSEWIEPRKTSND